MSLVVLNTVGLTSRMLPHAPRLAALGWHRPLDETVPSVTCASQATLLTGKTPTDHGIVGNGWLYRDTHEVRFWQQSNSLIQAEPLYVTAKKRRPGYKVAKLFWWFNQGAQVDWSVTPKPHYGADGSKAFDILSDPPELAAAIKKQIGPFPFPTFWGPMAGLGCTQWIAKCAALVMQEQRPDLTLVYLPHLDYEPQRKGPANCDLPKLVGELDQACLPILDAARKLGSRVWVVNETCHVAVSRPIPINRALRKAGLLKARPGPFGEVLDTYASQAFAVCDHQIAHVYVRDPQDLPRVREVLQGVPGIASLYAMDERAQIGLDHARAGEIVALSAPDAWFAYPYWLDDAQTPDFAPTVDIHRKPGYDPCELFFDPKLWWPKGRVIRKLLMKKLGFRMLLDVVPLDATLVKGSHGLAVADPLDKPVLIGDGPAPVGMIPQTAVRDWILDTELRHT